MQCSQLHASVTLNIPAIPYGYLYPSRSLNGDNGYRIFNLALAERRPVNHERHIRSSYLHDAYK